MRRKNKMSESASNSDDTEYYSLEEEEEEPKQSFDAMQLISRLRSLDICTPSQFETLVPTKVVRKSKKSIDDRLEAFSISFGDIQDSGITGLTRVSSEGIVLDGQEKDCDEKLPSVVPEKDALVQEKPLAVEEPATLTDDEIVSRCNARTKFVCISSDSEDEKENKIIQPTIVKQETLIVDSENETLGIIVFEGTPKPVKLECPKDPWMVSPEDQSKKLSQAVQSPSTPKCK